MTNKHKVAGVVNSLTSLIGSTIKNILLALVVCCIGVLAIILGFVTIIANIVR